MSESKPIRGKAGILIFGILIACAMMNPYRWSGNSSTTNVDTHLRRARTHSDDGNHQAAIASCKDALRLDPNCADAYCMMGIAYNDLDEPDQALAALKRAVAEDPKHPQAHFFLGMTHKHQGRTAEAIAALETYLDLSPTARNAERIRQTVRELRQN